MTVSTPFTVVKAPPGTLPVASIVAPKLAAKLTSTEGHPAPVQLSGTATDQEDGTVNGTRFQWTAIDEKGHSTVLCKGSAVPGGGTAPGNGGPVVGIKKDCASVASELVMPAGNGIQATYTLRLDVWDSSGAQGTDKVQVVVVFQAL